MKIRQSLSVAFLTAVLAAFSIAASAKPHVKADYDRSTNFAAYKTFGIVSPPGTEVDGYPAEITDTFRKAVRAEMEKRGYQYAESNPDLLVNFSAMLAKKTGHDSLDKQEVGYYGYRQGERVPIYKTWSTYTYDKGTKEYVEGTLNIELIDAKAKQLVWEGVAIGEVRSKTLKAEDPSPQITKAIGHVFEKYPYKAK
ncbi:MAG TPA: DUF4136 domain-containing protein [Rhodanobacteraceae bacterium]